MNSSESQSFEREYQALRKGCALIEFSDASSFSVTGSDRQPFLHNFCTNEIKGLVPGASCEAFFTNVKGRIIGHGLVHCRANELVFIGAPGQGPQLVEHLDRYIIREDAQVRDTTGERFYLLVFGHVQLEGHSESVLWKFLAEIDTTQIELGPRHRLVEFKPRDLAFVLSCINAQGYVLARSEAIAAVRIEAGLPLYGIDFDEQNLPQEIGRDRQAISFSKGCYLGQETVARIDALGHVNQKLVGVRFFGREVPASGTQLTRNGAAIGEVRSATFSPALNAPLALAIVRREATAASTRLESPVGDCEVVALPLIEI